MNKSNRNIIIGSFVLIWFALVTVLYFITHKPFTPEFAMAISMNIWRVVIAAMITSIAGGIGLKFLIFENLHPLARLGIAAAFGYGILALVMMVIGLLHGFTILIFIPLVVLLVVLLRKEIIAWWKLFGSIPGIWKETTPTWRVAGIIMGGMALFSLCAALAPPVKYDALMYHLTMPAAYLSAGGLEYLPWLAMTGMPQATEMLYTLGMAFGGNAGATVLGWWFALMALVGLFGFVHHRLDNSSAWVAVTSLMAGYTFVAAMAWGYVDWLGLLFGLGGLICLDLWRSSENPKLLVFSGIFTGFAFSTKYTAGVLVIVLAVVFCWHCFQTKRTFFTNAFRFAFAALVAMLPWLLRNWGMTGNPFYPFFFPAGTMDSIRIEVYQGLPAWGDWKDLFLLPFQATYMGVDGRSGYSVSIGPILLGLGVLAWVNARRLDREQHSSLQSAAVAAITGLLVWIIGNQYSGYLIQTRMYFSIFPAYAILAAFGFFGINRLELTQFRPARIVTALIFLVLGLNATELFSNLTRSGSVPYIIGIKNEEEFLDDNLGWYSQVVKEMRNLPEGSRIVMLYEPRGLYCLPKCEPDEILDRWKHDLAYFNDPQTVLASWKQQGFTHILYNKAGTEFLREDQDPHHPVEDLNILDQTLEDLELVSDFGGMYQIYRMP